MNTRVVAKVMQIELTASPLTTRYSPYEVSPPRLVDRTQSTNNPREHIPSCQKSRLSVQETLSLIHI